MTRETFDPASPQSGTTTPTNAEAAPGQPDAGRRSFTKVGIAAPFVVATLASKPALGGAHPLCMISGQFSGNASFHGPAPNCRIGNTPDYWKTHTAQGDWPAPFLPGQLFNVAGKPGYPGPYPADDPATTTGKTMLQVLSLSGGTGNEALARQTVAAILNAAKYVPDFPLTVAEVVAIWNEVAPTGFYHYSATQVWTTAQVTSYFESLTA